MAAGINWSLALLQPLHLLVIPVTRVTGYGLRAQRYWEPWKTVPFIYFLRCQVFRFKSAVRILSPCLLYLLPSPTPCVCFEIWVLSYCYIDCQECHRWKGKEYEKYQRKSGGWDRTESKVRKGKHKKKYFFMNAFARRFDLTVSLLNGNLLWSYLW